MHYQEYLQTDYWRAVSAKVKERAGYKCQVCNSPHDLEAHHRSYAHRGKELEHLDDLTCLCRRCHSIFHGRSGLVEPKAAPSLSVEQIIAVAAAQIGGAVSLSHAPKKPTQELIAVTPQNHKRLRNNKEMWHWMKDNGFEPNKSGWAKRMIGQNVPRHYFKGHV